MLADPTLTVNSIKVWLHRQTSESDTSFANRHAHARVEAQHRHDQLVPQPRKRDRVNYYADSPYGM